MAILKHIANKSKIYSGAEQYLCFEHDAKTGKPLLDDQGRMIARKGILKDSLNCDFNSFAAECMETNNLYHIVITLPISFLLAHCIFTFVGSMYSSTVSRASSSVLFFSLKCSSTIFLVFSVINFDK